jgi:hypothetical protein
MRKKQENTLDTEALRLGFQRMLHEVKAEIESGNNTESIKVILKDRKAHIETRLKELLPEVQK